jgi:hypothetical protein
MVTHILDIGIFVLCSASRLCVLGKCRVGKAKIVVWDCSSGRTSGRGKVIPVTGRGGP